MTTDRPASSIANLSGLWVLGVAEAVTFVLLLTSVLEGGHPGVRAGIGFVHGCVYLLSLGVAWRWVSDSHAKGLAVIPGVGALLLARALSTPAGQR